MPRGALLVVAVVGLAVVILAAVLLAGGSAEDSAQLRSLEADPMARHVPPGATLDRSTARAERSTGTLSKAQPARLSRVLSVPAAAARRALEDALAAARAAGWELRVTRAGLGATGTKQLATGPAILTIALSERAGASRLQIALEHVQV